MVRQAAPLVKVLTPERDISRHFSKFHAGVGFSPGIFWVLNKFRARVNFLPGIFRVSRSESAEQHGSKNRAYRALARALLRSLEQRPCHRIYGMPFAAPSKNRANTTAIRPAFIYMQINRPFLELARDLPFISY